MTDQTFTASNGVRVKQGSLGLVVTDRSIPNTVIASSAHETALREFYRAEEDERLGRWRYPADPDFVAYPTNHPRGVRVFRESTAQTSSYTPDEVALSSLSAWAEVAKAYFDAHPEPKPWHDAKPGEVWALKFGVSDTEDLVQAKDSFFVSLAVDDRWFDTMGKLAPNITAGRRIWPEVS